MTSAHAGFARASRPAIALCSGMAPAISRWRVDGDATGGAADGVILSPMPGRFIALSVATGDRVATGQKLLIFDGCVVEVNAAVGVQVTEGSLLARIEKDAS